MFLLNGITTLNLFSFKIWLLFTNFRSCQNRKPENSVYVNTEIDPLNTEFTSRLGTRSERAQNMHFFNMK